MKHLSLIAVLSGSILFSGHVVAQADLFVFPREGQSNEQMERDKADCHFSAGQQTGFGMSAPQTATASGPQGGEVVRGAARGAAAGAAIGAMSGNAGAGAQWGAVGGSVLGGRNRRNQQRSQAQEQDRIAQQEAAVFENYRRAMTACLDARGYSVS